MTKKMNSHPLPRKTAGSAGGGDFKIGILPLLALVLPPLLVVGLLGAVLLAEMVVPCSRSSRIVVVTSNEELRVLEERGQKPDMLVVESLTADGLERALKIGARQTLSIRGFDFSPDFNLYAFAGIDTTRVELTDCSGLSFEVLVALIEVLPSGVHLSIGSPDEVRSLVDREHLHYLALQADIPVSYGDSRDYVRPRENK